MVWNVALRAGNSSAKETFLVAPFHSDRFVRFSIEHNLDCHNNTPPPTGSNNAVDGNAQGQCAALAGGVDDSASPPDSADRRLNGRISAQTSAIRSRQTLLAPTGPTGRQPGGTGWCSDQTEYCPSSFS